MPTIKKTRKSTKVPYKSQKAANNAEKYNSIAWRQLRNTYISLRPLCECCLSHNCVEPATEVHHIVPWATAKNDIEQWKLLLTESNLMSVCKQCHIKLHKVGRGTHSTRLDHLTDKQWRDAHCILTEEEGETI